MELRGDLRGQLATAPPSRPPPAALLFACPKNGQGPEEDSLPPDRAWRLVGGGGQEGVWWVPRGGTRWEGQPCASWRVRCDIWLLWGKRSPRQSISIGGFGISPRLPPRFLGRCSPFPAGQVPASAPGHLLLSGVTSISLVSSSFSRWKNCLCPLNKYLIPLSPVCCAACFHYRGGGQSSVGRKWGAMERSRSPAGVCSLYFRPGPAFCTDVLETDGRSRLQSAASPWHCRGTPGTEAVLRAWLHFMGSQ